MRRIATVVCVLAAAIAATLFVVELTSNQAEDAAAASRRQQHLIEVVDELDSEAIAVEAFAADVASECAAWAGGTERDIDSLTALLRGRAENADRVSGVGVCFAPDAVVDGLLGVNLLIDKDEVRRIDDYYDYSVASEVRGAWYREALAHPDGHWHDPYFGGSSQRMLIEYTRGIVRDGELIGVAFVNWRYSDIGSILLSLDVVGTNEALVVTDSGVVVFSGHESWFEHGATISSVAERLDIAADVEDRLLHSPSGESLQRASRHGQIDVLWKQVPTHGWRVVLTFYDDAALVAERQRSGGPIISIFVVLFLLAAAIAIYHGRGDSNWDVAMAITVVFVAATAYLWWLAYEHGGLSPPTKQERLVDQSDVQTATAAHIARSGDTGEAPIFLPTGVFIQSARFASAHDVIVTGYVWQRAPAAIVASDEDPAIDEDEHDAKLKLGIVLPESESTQFEKVYTRRQGDDVVVGWYFSANLRQPFDYGDYPFESEEVWIRLWPRQFHRNVVLVPDLESYDPRPTSAGLGIEQTMFLPGWNLRATYFSHRPRSYNTNFGLNAYEGQLDFPELYFNVEIQRQVTSPFITHIVPLLIVLMTLFILLSVTGKESVPEIGFTSIAVIGTIVGIFFVVILQHISLRRSLQASGFMYLEVFYFLTYLYILLVAVNSVVSVVDVESRERRPGVCARTRLGWVCFAPLALAKLLLVTGARFLSRGGNRSIRYVYWPLYFGLIWFCTLFLTLAAAE